ncbi:hypothetical protein FACS1894159_00380 [Bacteroidia bacterium]|nr:hypothetical protein FACS1894159_00380 [Bacteroidia bacterium]
MRNFIYFLSAIIVLCFASCGGKDDPKPAPPGPGGLDPERPVVVDITGTAVLPSGGGGLSLNWGNTDSFRLYDNVITGTGDAVSETVDSRKMSIANGGTASATFAGMVKNYDKIRSFYAIYPYGNTTASDLTRHTVSLTATQSDVNQESYHIIAIAQATSFTGNPGEDNPLTLNFQCVTSALDVTLTNNANLSVKSVKLATVDGVQAFTTGGTVNLKSASAPVVTSTTSSASVGVTFTTAKTAASISTRLYLLPVSVTDPLKLLVTLADTDNTELEFTLNAALLGEAFSGVFAAGAVRTLALDLADADTTEPEPDPDPLEAYYTWGGIDGNAIMALINVAAIDAEGVLTLPDKATAIVNGTANAGVFMNNAALKRVNLNNVKEIGYSAFKTCANLAYVDAPNVETVMNEAFNGCTKLETVVSPKLATINAHAFRGCSLLKTIDLGNVTSMTGQNNFYQCAALEDAIMPNLEGFIPFQAFMQCTKLKNTNFAKVIAVGADVGNNATSNVGQVFANCDALTTLSFPSATHLSWRAINAGTITSLSIPKVETLAPQALGYLSIISYISLPKLVTIGNNAFNQGLSQNIVIDLSEATGITGPLGTNLITDVATTKIYVASQAIKDLFPAYTNATVTVGTPPPAQP